MKIKPTYHHLWANGDPGESTLRAGGFKVLWGPECSRPGVGAQWRFLPSKHPFGIGAQLKWGTNGSETTPDFAIHLSKLGDLWVHFEGVFPRSWFDRTKPDGSPDWDTRVFTVNVSSERVEWSWWARDGHWSSKDPWWMHGYWTWERIFFGRARIDTEITREGTTNIPMPEGNYPATWNTKSHTRTFTSRLGPLRDRLLGKRVHFTTEVSPGKPVPVPGKGENSWDLDDDAIHSTSVGGQNVSVAIGAVVQSAMETRRRHGGEHMNAPTA